MFFSENFNISSNNIISVESTKVLWYSNQIDINSKDENFSIQVDTNHESQQNYMLKKWNPLPTVLKC
jgi:hypothetical protein